MDLGSVVENNGWDERVGRKFNGRNDHLRNNQSNRIEETYFGSESEYIKERHISLGTLTFGVLWYE